MNKDENKPRSYRPSNGTEGMSFMEEFCDQCIHECPLQDSKRKCDILTATMVYDFNDKEYPKEWIYGADGHPTCTNFLKWDWGNDGDPDDPDNPKAPVPKDPMQLFLPFELNNVTENIASYPKEKINC